MTDVCRTVWGELRGQGGRFRPRPGLLCLATQAPDILWCALNLLGIERTAVDPALAGTAVPFAYYHPYSHSLSATVVQAALAATATGLVRRGTRRESLAAPIRSGATVCSHWALDLIAHRPNLPLRGDRRKVGLGLSVRPVAAFATEALLLVGGLGLYLRSASPRLGTARTLGTGASGLFLLFFQWLATARLPNGLPKGALIWCVCRGCRLAEQWRAARHLAAFRQPRLEMGAGPRPRQATAFRGAAGPSDKACLGHLPSDGSA